MYAYRLAYDGRPFHGFQRQPEVRTIEGALLSALRELGVLTEKEDTPPAYSAAGRTDAGVSALAQTVAFEAPDWLDPAALNSELPESIRAWGRSAVPESFHATRDATERAYRYYLFAPEASLDRAQAAADRLSGYQDYHNLTPADERTTRELAVSVTRDGPLLVVTCRAGGFVHELVRRIASLIDAVATGTASQDRVDTVLGEEPISGPPGVAPASPEPLVLTAVVYPEVTIDPAQSVLSDIIRRFEERSGAALARARVQREIADGIAMDR